MVKAIIAALLSFAFISGAYAQSADRIEQLEKEVQELKGRISKLEAQLRTSSPSEKPVTSNESWKSIANWRRLATNMTTNDVRSILGEPQRLDGGNMASWYYQNRGTVVFMDGKVHSWTEPRQ